jgi:plasmid stability protein
MTILTSLEALMAVLSIRNLPDDVHQRLRIRAARHGRSMEARELLTAAVEAEDRITPEALQAFVAKLYDGKPPRSASQDLIDERRAEAARE